jgi:hypothetical protein
MKTKTITMPQAEAKKKADAYRKSLANRNDPEYLAALTVYEALEKGLTVIDVGAAIRDGGFDAKMRPRLAIARADRRQVSFTWYSSEDTGTFDASAGFSMEHESLMHRVNFNRRRNQSEGNWGKTVGGFALVPLIPADVRPKGQAKDWHILWEVEQWADKQIGAVADRDPYLLRRLAGDLFVILAEWDLTEVERLVTQGRAMIRS